MTPGTGFGIPIKTLAKLCGTPGPPDAYSYALSFERNKTIGFRLNIPSGSSVRFEPGQIRDVILVSYSGEKVVKGFNAKIQGSLEG